MVTSLGRAQLALNKPDAAFAAYTEADVRRAGGQEVRTPSPTRAQLAHIQVTLLHTRLAAYKWPLTSCGILLAAHCWQSTVDHRRLLLAAYYWPRAPSRLQLKACQRARTLGRLLLAEHWRM